MQALSPAKRQVPDYLIRYRYQKINFNEAFSGRGRGDYAGSHDLEDLLTVIDGRAAIVQEIANVASLGSYIACLRRSVS